MAESENMPITTNIVSNSQGSSKKLSRKIAKVKPEEVSTPTHFEHLVHIEDVQSNANNFVVRELSHDPIIRNIFNMIEKNIADADRNSITVATPTDNITKLCLEPIKKNRKSSPENVAVYTHNIETYDNFNNLSIPSCTTDEKQSVQKRNNLKLSLKCSRKGSDDEKRQSIPYTLASNFREDDDQKSTKNFLMLSKHPTKSISSSGSTETTSFVAPLTPTFQYPNPKKQEAAYDALISRNTEEVISESLLQNQEASESVNSMTTDTNSFETKLIDFNDQMEIREALKQLDDALDEQIPIETFQTLNSKNSIMKTVEGKAESTKSDDKKKSVKQLVEMLDSKKLQFKINQDSNFISNSESNTETKTSLYVSDSETVSKPSLIGINIFGLNNEKSIAEIIAEKRNYKNHSIPKHPPKSPKPVLKKPLPIPKSNTSDEEEQQKLFYPSSSSSSSLSTQAVHPSEKTIFDNRRENMNVTVDKKPKIQSKHQKISNSEMLPTIIKVDGSESSANFQPTVANLVTSAASTITDDTRKEDSSQQYLSEKQNIAVNHIYENLNQNGNEKYLETSFDGPIAMTTASESKSGTTKNLDASHIFHHHHRQQQQQQHRENFVTNKEKHFIDNISTIIPVSSYDPCNYVRNVKWRNDSTKPANFVSLENGRNSEPIPLQQTCFKRNSCDSVSDKRVQPRTSMYDTSNNNESNDIAMKCGPNIVQQHPSSSTARISARPKPAPRQIDYMKRTTVIVDMPEIENRNSEKELKRPVPIPRQSKLKIALNDDLLKRGSYIVTKTQHGIINNPESTITIAKTMNKADEEENDRGEWMLRL
ncbi:unnamed protein product [Cercopithifilaria johnstoni]|uniref:CRIB domain-containing protein n=1 Tax=Cercopithifilaria johnstoni TaxID=2874296 RepID=A0A8J2LVB1_9BILA|nr:unnamed protein product [Cercopithifilaria johnstoni]